ncbi:MAG TPA: hypothetical protein VMV46_10515 [Thermoanaerobaculia bacterium]|nr:hypothetical protein [Thermoanaerobaculia bacterium]
MFVSHRAHFRDPLVDEEWAALADCDAAADPAVLRVVEEVLPRYASGRRPAIYFPAPMARALAGAEGAGSEADRSRSPRDEGGPEEPPQGDSSAGPGPEAPRERAFSLADLEADRAPRPAPTDAGEAAIVDHFHYDLIHVDAEQQWIWRGRPVGERARRFFLEHLGWSERIGRWFFEFRVLDGWWDKSYLETEVTPLTAIRLEELEGCALAHLSSGQGASVELDSFRLDERERLYCRTAELGEVMLSATVRFQVLSTISEDMETVEVAGGRRRLAWPRG